MSKQFNYLFLLIFSFGTVQAEKNAAKKPSKTGERKISFNYEVRPILVQNCYFCHGPDPSSRKAGLRLDTYEEATKLIDGKYRPIDPKHPENSEIIKRITSKDPYEMMPPPKSHLKVTEKQAEILKQWIAQGAEWQPHWAFLQPEDIKIKKYKTSANKIDDFVSQKITEKGLTPGNEANKRTLMRRLSFVLTGLPPKEEDIQRFINNSSKNAYEEMVDYYLNSKTYGERWARHWLDLVRYGETKGHEHNKQIRGVWKYRDYLIRAFNDDVSYAQLVKEQLAGDLMTEGIRWNPETGYNESILGTAFYNLGDAVHSPVDIKKDQADRIDNIIDVTSKTFQGLTVACARCHDHKFDPIPTKDYYALYGMLQSTNYSYRPADATQAMQKNAEEVETLRKYVDGLVNITKDKFNPTASVKVPEEITMLGDFTGEDFGDWKSDGLAFGNRTTLGRPVVDKSNNIIAIQEGKASSKYYSNGVFGVLRSPNFIIDKDILSFKARGKNAQIRVVTENLQIISGPLHANLSVNLKDAKNFKDYAINVNNVKGLRAYIEIYSGSREYSHAGLNVTDSSVVEIKYAIAYNNTERAKVSAFIKEKDAAAKEYVTKLQNELLPKIPAKNKVELVKTYTKINSLLPSLKSNDFFVGAYDGFGLDSKVFIRGGHTTPSKESVPRKFLSVIADEDIKFDSKGSNRMQMVETILSPKNALTSKVMVNRIWHHIFGKGIVETVDNFGLQGKLPTHPELLDHLSIKFRKEGWSIKNMIKYMVMSNTFRREVEASTQISLLDPQNTWLTHYPVRRLEAEAIRDALLAAAGNLKLDMYGKPIPTYLNSFMNGRGRPASGKIDGEGRRSIYQSVSRNFISPFMSTFDFPNPFTTFGNRNTTNVPAQSLILMNNQFVKQQAGVMAKSILKTKAKKSFEEKVNYAYQKAFSRNPKEEEIQKSEKFFTLMASAYKIDGNAAKSNETVWTDYCHSLFNLKEFIYLK